MFQGVHSYSHNDSGTHDITPGILKYSLFMWNGVISLLITMKHVLIKWSVVGQVKDDSGKTSFLN